MFIMKKDLFNAYCEWLFDILFKAEKIIDTTNYNVQEYRVFGFLAERLCGLYFTYLSYQENLKIGQLPKVMFKFTNKVTHTEPISHEYIPIVLSANDRFVPYLDVMIHSIIKHSSDNRKYDILVLNTDITSENKNITIQENKKDNISIRFIDVNDYFDNVNLFVDKHLSIETYYRLIIPEIMPNYHKVLYLDCDMVAMKDVAELYDRDLNGNIIGAIKDIDIIGQYKNGDKKLQEYLKKYLDMDEPYDYFQCGTLIIDLDRLRNLTSSNELMQVALENSFRCHDQDVFNKVFKGHVHYLPQKWNVLINWEIPLYSSNRMNFIKMAPREMYYEYMEARQDPYIIHYAGEIKPWNCPDCDFAQPFWNLAKETNFYPLILSQIKTNLAYERYMAPIIIANTPIPVHKNRLRRACECIADHGISYSIILLFRRIAKRLTGNYKIVNDERIYDD